MVGLLRDRLGDEGVVVGDRADTDGRFAVALGYRFALVLSGVTTTEDLPVEPAPWTVAGRPAPARPANAGLTAPRRPDGRIIVGLERGAR